MVKKLLLATSLAILFNSAYAQKAIDNSVQITASVQQSPARVTLSWTVHANATGYTIYKKAKNAGNWTSIAGVGSTVTQYVDNSVSWDSAYEYRVRKATVNPNPIGEGYIYVGLNTAPIHDRGSILLVIDSTFISSCQNELTTLMDDISADGWEVLTKYFNRTTKDVFVKDYIKGTAQSIPSLNAVFIIGHIAVPYSGNMAPDGHTPDHLGAWPADLYYAELNGTWTDNIINNSNGSRAATKNIIGDGKWDQSTLPSSTELQISRIDFYDMPAFGKTEAELMKSYLNRAHQYKTGNLAVIKRGLIDDNFPGYDEAFAANGWRNFSPLVNSSNIKKLDFISTLNKDFYQWAYGCGAGSYKKATGIGYTDSFANNNTNAIFTMLFGSYFGDWDNRDNFLRAPLCSSTPALTSCWAGRPNWFFHHMALGEHIGYSAFISQNNTGVYSPTGIYATGVYANLHGDLTLRTDYFKSATNLQLTNVAGKGAVLNWTASTEPGVTGYYVYMAESKYGKYQKRSDLITGTTFTDSIGIDGLKWYMVRAVKVEQTPSGTYNNLSLGVKQSAHINYPILNIKNTYLADQISIYPNPVHDYLNISIPNSNIDFEAITISNIIGKKMAINTTQKSKSYMILDVSAYPLGVYLLQMNMDNKVITKKWIKN